MYGLVWKCKMVISNSVTFFIFWSVGLWAGLVLTELIRSVNQMMILTALITSRNDQKIAAIR